MKETNMTFWTQYRILNVKALLVLLLFVAGCESITEKRDIIWGFNETELNPVKAVYDPNDPNKVIYYEVTTKKDHTGWYVSRGIMKQTFKIEVK